MSRRFLLQVRKAIYNPAKPYVVHVPDSLQKAEGAKRRFFEKEAVAKAYVKRLERQLGEYHLQSLGLNDEQKVEAAKCFQLLSEYNVGLLQAVQHHVEYLKEANRSIPVSKLVEEFLAVKRQDNLSVRYIQDLRSKLGRFAKVFGQTLACNLTTASIENWIRGMKVGGVSRESYRRGVAVMLEYGRRRGLLRVNPAADIKIARRIEGEVTILSPDEVSNLLKHCAPEIVPYVTICAFAGVRPSEAGALQWEDIHFETMQIEVKAKHSKTRRYRLVPIQPNLAAWLQLHRMKSGPIGFSRRKFREAYKAAGMDRWKMDVLRHSYGTYRLPIIKSADALALEMGNSPDVIFRHYRRPMTETTAQAYFEIMPESPGDIAAASDAGNEMFPDVIIQGCFGDAPGARKPDSGHRP